MRSPPASKILAATLLALVSLCFTIRAQAFVHPGLLHTSADFQRMQTKVAAGAQPWTSGYNALTSNGYSQLNWTPRPLATVVRGGTGDNVAQMYIDIKRAYQTALRWKVSGDTRYADQSIAILNAWSSTMTTLTGNSDRFLASGLHGYQWANVGEIMRTYSGWAAADVARFQNMLVNIFYPMNHDFLVNHNGAAITNYWANWDLCNISAMLAIGVFCDRTDIYNEAVAYIYRGAGNGAIDKSVYYVHPGNLGQWQEAGRDQGHTTLGIVLMGPICEMAWNQGLDLYSYGNYRFLAGAEYVAKYNYDVANTVPFVPYMWGTGQSGTWQIQTAVSSASRPNDGNCWELVYNHYVNRLGLAAPWSAAFAAKVRPEGYVSGADQLGFGTLTFTRDPIASGVAPKLTAAKSAGEVVLSWWGSAYALSYNVKRSATSGGPYVTIAANVTGDLTYTDTTATSGDYYYVVTGVLASAQETGASNEVRASFPPELDTWLKADETTGTTAADATARSHSGTLVNGPTWVAGKSGNAVSLDGTNDYVSLPTGIVSGLSDFTVSAWVYLNDSRTWSRIFDFGGKPGAYMYLTPRADSGKARFTIGTVYDYNEQQVESTSALPTGQWVHVAVTLSGQLATLYVNGIEAGRNAEFFLQPGQLVNTDQNWIGRSQTSSDPYLSGKVDDFRIYKSALSGGAIYNQLWNQNANRAPVFSDERLTLANATEDSNYSAAAQTLASKVTNDGDALTFAKLDGPAWLTVASNGALSGTPTNDDVGLNIFTARVTDPSGAGSVVVLKITVLNTNDAPAWTANPLSKPGVSANVAYSGTLADSASDVDAGSSLTFSKVSGPAWLSVAANGALSGTPATGDIGANSFTVRVTDNAGARTDATLSITVLSNSLQSNYVLNGSGTDSVGGGTATISGTATYVAGVSGQALSLDGTSNSVKLGSLSSLVYKDMTVAAWVYWNGRSAWQRIFDFGSGTDQYMFLTPYNGGTGMRFAIKVAGVEQSVDAAALPIGQWVHVAVTLGGDTATIYVNGVAKGSSASITNNPNAINLTNNYIGKSQFSTDPLFNGKIDDFRIYNYALSASEVSALLSSVPVITPTNVTAFSANGKVRLTWSPSANAATYTVKRSGTSGGTYTTVSGGSGLTATTFSDTGLTNGTTYYYVVSATNSTNVQSANSAEAAGTPRVDVIDVVNSGFETPVTFTYAYAPSGAGWTFSSQSGVNGAGISANGSAFTSANSAAPEGLQVALLQGSGSISQALSGFIPGTSYTVTFTAANRLKSGDSQNWSVQIDGTTVKSFSAAPTSYADYTAAFTASAASHTLKLVGTTTTDETVFIDNVRVEVTPPPIPSGLTATDIASTQLTLSWDASSGATGYNIKRSTTSGGPYTTVDSVSGTTFTDVGLSAGVTYRYVVSALNSLTESPDSAELSVTAVEGTPLAPTGLTASAGNAKVTLSWTAAFGAASYSVKRAILGGTYSTIDSNVSVTNYTDSGLTAGVTYLYKVSATNSGGESPDSAEASATTFGALPTGWTSGNVNGGSGSAVYGQEKQFVISGAGGAFTTSSTDSTAGTMGGFRFLYMSANSTTQVVTARVVNPPTVAGAQFGLLIRRVAPGGSDNRMAALVMEADGTGTYRARLGVVGSSPGTALVWSGTTTGLTLPRWIRLTRNGSSYTAEVSANGSTWTTVSTDGYAAPATSTYYAGLFVSSASGAADVLFDNVSITADSTAAWTPPAAPTGLTATLSGSNANLAWTAVSGATSYRVERASVSGGPYVVVATGVTANSYSDPIASGPWYYIVRTISTAGVSAASTQSSGVTAVPGAPTGVTATPANAKVSLAWTASSRATSYTVKRATTSGGPYTTVTGGAAVTGTAFTNTGLTNDTTYYYIVTATNSAGTSLNSAEVNATPVFLPQSPTGVTVAAGNSSVALNWNATGTATSYIVKRSTTSGSGYETVATGVKVTSFTDTGVVNGTVYYYVISAVNNNGEGSASAEIVITPHLPATINKADNTDNLNLISSWSGSVLPNGGDIAKWSTLAGANSVLLGANFSVKGINIATTGGAVAIGGSNILTLGTAGIDMSAATQNLTISSGLTLGAGNQVWNVVSGKTLTLNTGTFTRDPGATLNIPGAGTITANMTGLANDSTGILGGWATFGNSGGVADWAALNSGNVAAYSTYASITAATAANASQNWQSTSGTAGISATGTINSLKMTADFNIPNSVTLTVGSGGILMSGVQRWLLNNGAGSTGGTGKLTSGMASGELFVHVANSTATNWTIWPAIIDNGATPTRFVKSGAGLLYLANANTFTGDLNINGGTLVANLNSNNTFNPVSSALGNPQIARNITIDTGGTLRFGVGDSLGGATSSVVSTLVINAGGTVTNNGSAFTTLGPVKLNGGTLTGTGGSGNGAYQMYSLRGDVTVGGRTPSTISVTGAGNTTNNFHLGANTTFDVAEVTGDAAADLIVSAVLMNQSGGQSGAAGGLTKSGAGTMSLTSTSTYTGATTINAGTFQVNGALNGGGAVSVKNTGALSGVGTISGPVTVASGGSLAPGDAGAGVLTITGALSLSNGSMLDVAVGGEEENRIALGGTFAATGTTTVNITALNEIEGGTYPLITGAAGINAASFTLGVTPPGYVFALSASNGTLWVTVTAPPAAPTGLTATPGNSSVILNWSASDSATTYYVKRASSDGGPYTTLVGSSTTSYTNTGLASGTTYYYVVSAANAAGESADSGQVSATPLTAIQSWRQTYFGTTSNTGNATDTADPDGDGMTNAQEYTAGTDPKSAASAFKVSQLQPSGNDTVVSFATVAGKTYRVEFSNTLVAGSWSPVLTNNVPADNIAGTGGAVQITDTNGALQLHRFYRVVVLP